MSKPRSGAPKRMAAGLLASALAVTGLAFAPTAGATASVTTERFNGTTRWDTAAKVSADEAFATPKSAIVATGLNFPDALAASTLAGTNAPSPIILTETTKLTKEASDALTALKGKGITAATIVGGTSAVSQATEDAIKALGLTVTRVEGTDTAANRYGTAAAIATAANKTTPTGSVSGLKAAFFATGLNFPDAIAAAPGAYAARLPVLLVNSTVPAETTAAITSLGIKKAYVLGGTGAVSDTVATALATATGNPVTRLEGTAATSQDRFGTASAIADFEVASLGFTAPTSAILANGTDAKGGYDALTAGPLGGQLKAPVLLTASLPSATQKWLDTHSNTLTKLYAAGGDGTIDATTLSGAVTASQTTTNDTNQSITVTPTAAASLTRVASNPDTSTTDDRQYTVNGLDSTKTYQVALFPAANVTTDATTGTVTFADTNSDNQADRVAPATDITVVNGAAQPTSTSLAAVAPVNGTISFTIDGDGANETVVPVIWTDTTGLNAGVLNLTVPTTGNALPKTPAEAFGVGGTTTYNPPAGLTGDVGGADIAITGADKTANTITTGAALYSFDENDNFYVYAADDSNTTVSETNRVTFAAFKAAVSAGDELDERTFYQATASLPSTFVIENLSPAAPAATVLLASNTTISFTVTGLVTGATANVYCRQPATGVAFSTTDTTIVLRGTNTADADATTAGYQIVASGLTAGTTADCWVQQVVGGETSGASALVSTSTTAVAAALTPTSTATSVADLGTGNLTGILDGTDVIQVQFDRDITLAANASLTLTDVDGTIGTVTCGTNATCNSSGGATPVVTLTMTAPAVITNIGNAAGVATATAVAITSATGISNSTGTWNLAKSGIVGSGKRIISVNAALSNSDLRGIAFTTVASAAAGTARISATGGTNEVQTTTVGTAATAGGPYTLSFNGATTTPLAFNATLGTIQAALEALSTVGTGNVTVTGSATNGYASTGTIVVTFTGELGSGNVPQVTRGGTALTTLAITGTEYGETTPGVRPANLATGDTVTVYNPFNGVSIGSAVVPAFGPTVVTLSPTAAFPGTVNSVAKGTTNTTRIESQTQSQATVA